MTLYEITSEYRQLLDLAEEEEIDLEVLKDTLEGVEGEFDLKVENYGKIIKSMEGNVASVKAEIDRLTAKKRVMEKNIESIKKTLTEAMIALDKRKIKTPLFSFGVQKNPPSVAIADESKVPDIFFVPQDPKMDKKAILEYLTANGDQEWGQKIQTEGVRIR